MCLLGDGDAHVAAAGAGGMFDSAFCLLPLPESLADAASSVAELLVNPCFFSCIRNLSCFLFYFYAQVHELLSDTSDLYSELAMRSFAACRLQLQLREQHDASLQEDLDAVRRSIATDTVRTLWRQLFVFRTGL